MAKVLIACERSGRVREAIRANGHDAYSCDIQPSDIPGQHIQDDVLNVASGAWDAMIAFPPCTYLTAANARQWPQRQAEQSDAIAFVQLLWTADIEQVCIENPPGILSRHIGPPTQVVHPYYFGDPYSKRTCLWLRGFKPLGISHFVRPTQTKWYTAHGMRDRSGPRSITPLGLAKAMADQWFPPEGR